MKLIAFILIILSFTLLDNFNDAAPKPVKETIHSCRWPECPYHGVPESGYKKAVTDYVGEEGTDSWCIDMLHLQYPTLEYEALEELLFHPSGIVVLDTVRDERGLISVTFIQDGKQWGYDYLTQNEYDSLINK